MPAMSVMSAAGLIRERKCHVRAKQTDERHQKCKYGMLVRVRERARVSAISHMNAAHITHECHTYHT
jgi:hypothetical protein